MRIFFLTSRFPYPLEKGDKLRAFHQLKVLSEYHEIILCALSDVKVSARDIEAVSKYCKKVIVLPINRTKAYCAAASALMTKVPIQIAYFKHQDLYTKIEAAIQEEKPDHIYCQLIRCADYVKGFDIPKTLDYMDAFSFGIGNKAKKSSFLWSLLWRKEAQKLAAFEQAIYPHFDQHTIISKQDRAALSFDAKSTISIVKNGVDFDFFSPKSGKKEYDILFVGNMGYPPNQIAATYLVKEILPILKELGVIPKVLIAGARPSRAVKQLESDQVKVSGWLEDIRTAYHSARIVVAPIFTGSGLQNKILEAMAMGLPCITTEQVTKGIEAEDGQQLLVADRPINFAKAIKKLLENEVLQVTLRNNARNWVLENYQWDKIVLKLNQIIIATHER